jgi:tetratricopeptide (TPR) repeat protein
MPRRLEPSAGVAEIASLLQARRLEEARDRCAQLLRTQGDDATLWNLCGAVHGMLNDPRETERCAREAIRLSPGYAQAYNNLGLALRLQGRTEEAIAPLREAIRLKPDYADAYYNLGVALAIERRPDEAIESYRMAASINSDDVEILNDLGNLLLETGKAADATACYQQAIQVRPDYFLAHYNLGNACLECGQFDKAIAAFRQALRLNPRHDKAVKNLGVALEKSGNAEEAISVNRQALELRPDDADIHFNLGNALRRQGCWEEAAKSYRQSIALNPAHADAHFNLALIYLACGHLKDGWKEYSWQWRREGAPLRPTPLTPRDGSDFGGRRVFVYSEQGIGDEIFFLRFAPELKRRGAGHITYRASPKIASVLERVEFIDRIAPPNDLPGMDDVALALCDLPLITGTTDVRPPFPLLPLAMQTEAIRQRLGALGPAPYIGVTWRAGTPEKELVLCKESPLARLAHTFRSVPATILVLQRQPRAGEIEAFVKEMGRPAHDLSALNDDLESMLALLSLLDDYVGVSNTNMHLRAGVGKTARVLVPAPPEWRWMAEGKESPWFPGFGVYRQGYDGSWEGAFGMLVADLRQTFPAGTA